MPYKQSFLDLLKQLDYYSEALVQGSGGNVESLIHIINGTTDIKCEEIITKLITLSIDNPNVDYNSIIWFLSIPHIGLGNPNSKVLIIGKELGFEEGKKFPAHAIKHWTCSISPMDYYKRLFANEVLLNYYLWCVKVGGHVIPASKLCCLQDPEFPPSYSHLYNKEKKGLHTWKLINKVFENKYNTLFPFTTNTLGQSFFQNCFLTELNLVPSSRSVFVEGMTRGRISRTDIDDRFQFLISTPFYRDFETIIFGCLSYLKKYVNNYSTRIELAYGVNKIDFESTRNIVEIYEGQNIRIILTHQLSGSRAWSDQEVISLSELI